MATIEVLTLLLVHCTNLYHKHEIKGWIRKLPI